MPYTFRQIPDVGTVEELRQWLSEELKLISESLNESIELELRASKHEPERPREGMIVHADGAAWNPGTGAGTYRYQSGAWVKITSPADLGAYLPLAGGQMTGRLELANGTVTGNSGMATGTGSLGEIEAQNNGTGAAMMAFHRSGAFAGYFGLDTDNVFKIGGWSFGANAYKVWTEQTLPVFGAAVAGYVPASGGGTTNFLRADAAWALPPPGMTRVGSVAATSGTTASITGIPACKVLYAFYRNISHDNGANQTFRFALSTNNGSSYNTAQNMFSTAVGAAVSGSGLLTVGRMDQTSGGLPFQASFLAQILGGVDTVTTGAVPNAIQFSFTAGNFDDANGRIDVYVA